MNNKQIYNIVFFLSVVCMLLGCNEEKADVNINLPEQNTQLNFLVSTYSGNDPLEKDGDCAFSSLALYVFNKEDGYCEYASEFVTDPVSEFNKTVLVTAQTKVIYAIANYKTQEGFSKLISTDLSMTDLENLTVNSTGFSSDNILMIGKKELEIDSATVTVPVILERLVSRLDIYFFKSLSDENEKLEVLSVELVNRVLNSNCQFEDTNMLPTISKDNYTIDITANNNLSLMPPTLDNLIPENSHASFYTYQNLINTGSPDENTAYLLVKVRDNNGTYTFKGYITDNSQTSGKYSLKRNTVYRIIAIMNGIDDEIILNTSVLPWSVTSSEIGHYPGDSDFSLVPFDDNVWAINGIVQYPYAINGIGVNETSYANYSFRFTAPAGAVWTATLTNGDDFMFFKEGTIPGKQAVSKGIARDDEYEIKVGAKKPWNGTETSTNLYITVNGEKLKINPIHNNVRKFPGNNDTDILIKQTKYE